MEGEGSIAGESSRDAEFGGGECLLPLANVGRIMRERLPPNTRVSNEAKQAVQECAAEFVRFVAGEAADICKQGNRKSINGDDVIHAFHLLGFANYAETLQVLLEKVKAAKLEQALPADGQFVSQVQAGARQLQIIQTQEPSGVPDFANFIDQALPISADSDAHSSTPVNNGDGQFVSQVQAAGATQLQIIQTLEAAFSVHDFANFIDPVQGNVTLSGHSIN